MTLIDPAWLTMAEQVLLHFWVVFLRIGAMVAVLPAFGEQSVPLRIRLVISFSFVLITSPMLEFDASKTREIQDNLLLFSTSEAIVGLFFGVLLRFYIFALQVAGAIAAQVTSLSQIFGSSAGVDPQPVIGHVLTIAGLALAAIYGIHIEFSKYILNTYSIVPVGGLINPTDLVQLGVSQVARTFGLAFSLAAPFLIASLLYNVILGAINRAMPQLMVSFVGAPAITGGALLILAISSPLLLGVWLTALLDFTQGQ